MLNENQIEKYLYQYTKRLSEFILLVMLTAAERMRANNNINSLNTMSSLGESFKQTKDITKIRNAQDELYHKQLNSFTNDLLAIALLTYNELKSAYTVPIAYKSNDTLNRAINACVESSVKELGNVIRKPVFVLNHKSYAPADAYRLITQDALFHKAYSGQRRSVRNALNRLYDAPVKFIVQNTSDDDQSVTSAINTLRMSVLSGIKDVINNVNKVVKEQTKCDGVELSAHVCPAPDHAPAQGHQFSNEEFEKMQSGQDFVDVNGNHYAGFERQIGQWNCRHYVKPIKIGKSVPEHTQRELDKILADNEKGYTTSDGKHYTLYECTQVQRKYERDIRGYKEKSVLARAYEDTPKENEYRGKVTTLIRQYKAFSQQCNLPIYNDRLRIKEY